MPTIKQTTDTNSQIYKDALAIRTTVFVEEQGVPFEMELEHEEETIHLVLYKEDEAVATIRLFPKENNTVKLQRMAVLKPYRRHGYGRALIEEAERLAKAHGYRHLTLGAQLTAKPFYHALGYHAEGNNFMDAGIEHVTMVKIIAQ